MSDDPLVAAVARSIDAAALRRELERAMPVPPKRAEAAGSAEVAVLARVTMSDLLDEDILNARQGDASFPLRLFFGELGARLASDTAFALACGLNFFFRTEMDEEWRMRTGVEVSRLYYRFASEGALDAVTRKKVSPLLASLLSTELGRVELQSVDHAATFDSALHERAPGSSGASALIKAPTSMLCKVTASGLLRVKASVLT